MYVLYGDNRSPQKLHTQLREAYPSTATGAAIHASRSDAGLEGCNFRGLFLFKKACYLDMIVMGMSAPVLRDSLHDAAPEFRRPKCTVRHLKNENSKTIGVKRALQQLVYRYG